PRAIDVLVIDGRVTLTGPVRSKELDGLLRAIRSIPGVREVVNQLEPHDRGDQHPALQGGRDILMNGHGIQGRSAIGVIAGMMGLVAAVVGTRAMTRRKSVDVPRGASVILRGAAHGGMS